jgi:hypothetical protein
VSRIRLLFSGIKPPRSGLALTVVALPSKVLVQDADEEICELPNVA